MPAQGDAFTNPRSGTRIEVRGLSAERLVFERQLSVILHATGAQSYGARPPIPIQRASLPALAAIGRLRGYRPSY